MTGAGTYTRGCSVQTLQAGSLQQLASHSPAAWESELRVLAGLSVGPCGRLRAGRRRLARLQLLERASLFLQGR